MLADKNGAAYSQLQSVKLTYVNQFVVSLDNGFGEDEKHKVYLKDDELRILLDRILVSYNDYLAMTYADQKIPGDEIAVIDTDALVTRVFMDFLDGEDPKTEANRVLADAIDGLNSYDLILFLEPDVEFFLEGGRSEEIRDNREYYSNRIKELLRSHGREFVCVGGDYKERYEKAVAAVQELLSGKCDE